MADYVKAAIKEVGAMLKLTSKVAAGKAAK